MSFIELLAKYYLISRFKNFEMNQEKSIKTKNSPYGPSKIDKKKIRVLVNIQKNLGM
jgi:hypothetical protein